MKWKFDEFFTYFKHFVQGQIESSTSWVGIANISAPEAEQVKTFNLYQDNKYFQ